MSKHVFNGTKSVICLRFPSVFKTKIYNEGMQVAGSLKICLSFLSGKALDIFNGMTKDVTMR